MCYGKCINCPKKSFKIFVVYFSVVYIIDTNKFSIFLFVTENTLKQKQERQLFFRHTCIHIKLNYLACVKNRSRD